MTWEYSFSVLMRSVLVNFPDAPSRGNMGIVSGVSSVPMQVWIARRLERVSRFPLLPVPLCLRGSWVLPAPHVVFHPQHVCKTVSEWGLTHPFHHEHHGLGMQLGCHPVPCMICQHE